MSDAHREEHLQQAVCCFCGRPAVDGEDGLRMEISYGGPTTRILLWAHVTCLAERLLGEFAEYLDLALRSAIEERDAELDGGDA